MLTMMMTMMMMNLYVVTAPLLLIIGDQLEHPDNLANLWYNDDNDDEDDHDDDDNGESENDDQLKHPDYLPNLKKDVIDHLNMTLMMLKTSRWQDANGLDDLGQKWN